MIEFEDIIQNSPQFLSLQNEDINCNSFLFESPDELLLTNFSYCFAKFLFCTGDKKPCNMCPSCQKLDHLSHGDLKIYPKDRDRVLTEDVKDLLSNIYLSPIESDKKVFIFNKFSTATPQAQNKLLKILEEPPANTFIILNVTNVTKVLPTVLSRCKKLMLKTVSDSDLSKVLTWVGENEKLPIIENARGDLTKAVYYARHSDFYDIYSKCIDVVTKMKSSKEVLRFSCGLSSDKDSFYTVLEILESIFRDILLIRLGKTYLVQNKVKISDLKSVVSDYTCDATDLIIKKILKTREQRELNCNPIFLIDSLLLYILEVKFICNKKSA